MEIPALETISLKKGAHARREDGVCALEMVAWLAGEKHTDRPACCDRVLADFGRRLNDRLDDEARQRLKPLLPRMIGTANDGAEEARIWLLVDWAVREALPHLLDLFPEQQPHADALRLLPLIDGVAALTGARTKIAAAIEAAQTVSAAVYGHLDLDLALALALDLDLALALALDLDLDLAVALALDRLLDLAPAEAEAQRVRIRLIDESSLALMERMIHPMKTAA